MIDWIKKTLNPPELNYRLYGKHRVNFQAKQKEDERRDLERRVKEAKDRAGI